MMTDQAPPLDLRIDPGLKPEDLARAFKRFGRLHIPGFLTEASARPLHDRIAADETWVCSTRGGKDVIDVPVEMLDAMPDDAYGRFLAAAHAEARDGFHYMFDSVRISDARDRGETLPPTSRAIFDFINGPAFLGFVRGMTGDARPTYVDGQVTRYRPGHYLTRHDDHKPGEGRLFAYVLNLTPRWRADWGGLLAFHDEDGHLAEAYTPSWNALNVFAVPQPHAVTYVAPFAGGARLSITGWIRDDRPNPLAAPR